MLAAVEHLYVVAHDEVGIATEQKLRSIHLRTTHLDGHVETGLVVKPGRFGLIEAAMLGLREPAGQERHLVGGDGRCERCSHSHSSYQRGCNHAGQDSRSEEHTS